MMPPLGSVILIVAQSARAIAAAARRAGYRPVTVDFFADEDTREIALHAGRYPGGWRCGFRRRPLLAVLEAALADAGVEAEGLVLGSGFEDRPRLIGTLAGRWRLFGCGAEAVAAVKHPERFAAALRELSIPHPTVTRHVPDTGPDTGRWLVRRRGGSGGTHIRVAEPGPVPPHHYAQETAAGAPVSALVLADGEGADVVAFSQQWADPSPEAPFRFAGVAGPLDLPARLRLPIADAADRLARRFGLRGLVSMDLLVDGDDWTLLEINPRPGASIDALDGADGALFSAHLAASCGRRPASRPDSATIRATMVAYAKVDTRIPRRTSWPVWALDRSAEGSVVAAGAPVATVRAEAPTIERARRLATERAADILRLLGDPYP